MSEQAVLAEVSGLNDDELMEKLVENGVDAGPIIGSTRQAYQKMLTRIMLGKEYVPPEPTNDDDDDEEADNEEEDISFDEDDDDIENEEIDSALRQRYQERGSEMKEDPPPSSEVGQRRPNIFITFLKMVVIGVFAVTLLVFITSSKQ